MTAVAVLLGLIVLVSIAQILTAWQGRRITENQLELTRHLADAVQDLRSIVIGLTAVKHFEAIMEMTFEEAIEDMRQRIEKNDNQREPDA